MPVWRLVFRLGADSQEGSFAVETTLDTRPASPTYDFIEKTLPAGDDPRSLLLGTWVTTFPSFVYDEPVDDGDLPRIATYALPDPSNHPAPALGYFFAATLLCLKFDGQGNFSGRVAINRAGQAAPQPVVEGTYTAQVN